jgi:hypothetical protein
MIMAWMIYPDHFPGNRIGVAIFDQSPPACTKKPVG